MGMYTQFVFHGKLLSGDAAEVARVMTLAQLSPDEGVPTPDHELFHTERWETLLYYAHVENDVLYVKAELKNHGDEIGKFLDWVDPYLVSDSADAVGIREPIGFSLYEESDKPQYVYAPDFDLGVTCPFTTSL
jgi:hypothetical protein